MELKLIQGKIKYRSGIFLLNRNYRKTGEAPSCSGHSCHHRTACRAWESVWISAHVRSCQCVGVCVPHSSLPSKQAQSILITVFGNTDAVVDSLPGAGLGAYKPDNIQRV